MKLLRVLARIFWTWSCIPRDNPSHVTGVLALIQPNLSLRWMWLWRLKMIFWQKEYFYPLHRCAFCQFIFWWIPLERKLAKCTALTILQPLFFKNTPLFSLTSVAQKKAKIGVSSLYLTDWWINCILARFWALHRKLIHVFILLKDYVYYRECVSTAAAGV